MLLKKTNGLFLVIHFLDDGNGFHMEALIAQEPTSFLLALLHSHPYSHHLGTCLMNYIDKSKSRLTISQEVIND